MEAAGCAVIMSSTLSLVLQSAAFLRPRQKRKLRTPCPLGHLAAPLKSIPTSSQWNQTGPLIHSFPFWHVGAPQDLCNADLTTSA